MVSCFEGIPSLFFVIDLDNYDQSEYVRDAADLFDYICGSPLFKRTTIFLILNKSSAFVEKLAMSPLSDTVPGYSGGIDSQQSIRYILHRFLYLNHGRLSVYSSYVDLMDADTVRAAINIILGVHYPPQPHLSV